MANFERTLWEIRDLLANHPTNTGEANPGDDNYQSSIRITYLLAETALATVAPPETSNAPEPTVTTPSECYPVGYLSGGQTLTLRQFQQLRRAGTITEENSTVFPVAEGLVYTGISAFGYNWPVLTSAIYWINNK